MAGGKLFEQGGDAQPELIKRVAWGAAGSATSNSSWQTVVTWLEGVLGFLKTGNNLSDLNDDTEARTNLDVYSIGEVDAELALKANADSVLSKTNTTQFIPSSDYNPSTKKYSDGIRGSEAFGDIPVGGKDITISIGSTLPSSSYVPLITITGSDRASASVTYCVHTMTTTSFKVTVFETFATAQAVTVNWKIESIYL